MRLFLVFLYQFARVAIAMMRCPSSLHRPFRQRICPRLQVTALDPPRISQPLKGCLGQVRGELPMGFFPSSSFPPLTVALAVSHFAPATEEGNPALHHVVRAWRVLFVNAGTGTIQECVQI